MLCFYSWARENLKEDDYFGFTNCGTKSLVGWQGRFYDGERAALLREIRSRSRVQSYNLKNAH